MLGLLRCLHAKVRTLKENPTVPRKNKIVFPLLLPCIRLSPPSSFPKILWTELIGNKPGGAQHGFIPQSTKCSVGEKQNPYVIVIIIIRNSETNHRERKRLCSNDGGLECRGREEEGGSDSEIQNLGLNGQGNYASESPGKSLNEGSDGGSSFLHL